MFAFNTPPQPTEALGTYRTPEKVARGFGPQQISNLETGARPGERKALEEPAMQAPRDGERRPCPSPQENEEGLFMALKAPAGFASSAPEMWHCKHGPPPKRPRVRPVACYTEPAPLDLPEPDVPMSGLGQAAMAASCPAYVSFCNAASPDGTSLGLGAFQVPHGHRAGSPTTLESVGNSLCSMTVIDEEARDTDQSGCWDSSEEEVHHAPMEQDEEAASGDDADEVFEFDFSPTLE